MFHSNIMGANTCTYIHIYAFYDYTIADGQIIRYYLIEEYIKFMFVCYVFLFAINRSTDR